MQTKSNLKTPKPGGQVLFMPPCPEVNWDYPIVLGPTRRMLKR